MSHFCVQAVSYSFYVSVQNLFVTKVCFCSHSCTDLSSCSLAFTVCFKPFLNIYFLSSYIAFVSKLFFRTYVRCFLAFLNSSCFFLTKLFPDIKLSVSVCPLSFCPEPTVIGLFKPLSTSWMSFFCHLFFTFYEKVLCVVYASCLYVL